MSSPSQSLKPPQVVCLMGPTATGKTALAKQLVRQWPFAIVSVDSAMVYRQLNIGSAKPVVAELKQTPHYLINIRNIDQPYSVADFCLDAKSAISNIHKAGKIPLLVGGTMLYFKAIQQGLSLLPKANADIRAMIVAKAAKQGWQALHQELSRIDPKSAANIHPHDRQRLQRALEVYQLTGKSLSHLQQKQTESHSANHCFINIALIPSDRQKLRNQIAKRFNEMLKQGLVGEVAALYQDYKNADLPALRAIGYRAICDYLRGDYDYNTMKEKAMVATNQLAKRQMTWLRSWPNIRIFDSQDKEIFSKVNYLLKKTLD